MTSPDASPVQVIAMHGWGCDARTWDDWRSATACLGWQWQCGERGYGSRPAAMPDWGERGRRLVIGHSLGPHLLPPPLLSAADGVVLLASFGRFLPAGPRARRLRVALEGMAAELTGGPSGQPGADLEAGPEGQAEAAMARRAQAMLQRFMVEVAAPDPITKLPPGPADAPVGPVGRRRLREDLQLLAGSTGVPAGFPRQAAVLIVEAQADRIVVPEARALLRQALPRAELIRLEGAGHGLVRSARIPSVLAGLRRMLPP